MLPVLLRLLADAALVGAALFGAAGTLAWPRAWVLLAVMLVARGVGAAAVWRVSPALMRERARPPVHAGQPLADRVLLASVLGTGFVLLPLAAALDVFRWHALPPPHDLLATLGLVLFGAGWTIKSLALRANAFATTVVRVQRERAHAVVDTGVYGVVRHPFYAATPLVLVGMALWLGSSLAAVLAVVPVALVVARLVMEERFLRRELPGYAEYAARVPHRLVPGVW